jgi:hypothetical protein
MIVWDDEEIIIEGGREIACRGPPSVHHSEKTAAPRGEPMRVVAGFVVLVFAARCHVAEAPALAQNSPPAARSWKRAYTHRGAAPARGRSGAVAATAAALHCSDIGPLKRYRFIDGLDNCMQLMSASDIAALGDPFAVNVLAKGIGNASKWPATVESIVSLVTAVPNFGANQQSYMLGEGSQIPTTIAPRDAGRNLRYVITWGAGSAPTIFLSAAPSGTHPGRPPLFLQVIGYDQQKNLFNYYEFVSNPGQPTRSWALAANSDNARNPQTTGRGCMACHINGALNMKELVPPWNNWQSAAASISQNNIPAAVANDPLYIHLSGAEILQRNFQSRQSSYSQGLAAMSISGGTIKGVPALLRRLITTTTVNFTATPRTPTDTVQIPSDFFLAQAAFGTGQINLAFSTPAQFTVPATAYNTFIADQKFALQQLDAQGKVVYQQPGANFSALFVPAMAFEDVAMIQQLINQKAIDANFAASVLLVDFPNPIFSAARESLMKYANQISTAQQLGSGSNPAGIPAKFIALVQAAAKSQPACDPAKLLQCTPEQQFLFYAGRSDWKQRAQNQVNPYFAAVTQRLGTAAGVNDYLTLWASRQAQFAAAPGAGNLDEFSLLLPCNTLPLGTCKRMNADGTISDDPLSPCAAQTCASSP